MSEIDNKFPRYYLRKPHNDNRPVVHNSNIMMFCSLPRTQIELEHVKKWQFLKCEKDSVQIVNVGYDREAVNRLRAKVKEWSYDTRYNHIEWHTDDFTSEIVTFSTMLDYLVEYDCCAEIFKRKNKKR